MLNHICVTLKLSIFITFFITFLKGEQWDKNEARMDVPSLPSFANMVSCALRWVLPWESCFDRQGLLSFRHENREERKREQKFKRLNLGEEVILMWDWNLKTDVKEQKQLRRVSHWTGEAKGFLRFSVPFIMFKKTNEGLELFWNYLWLLHYPVFL